MRMLFFILLSLLPYFAYGYPEFIGYGYTSCLTCHFNGHGNGPINDYGRALWSAEIAGRAFAGNRTDDQLGNSSGFLGSKPGPWWLKPGIKAREIMIRNSPGGNSGKDRYILMQADVNAAFLLDRKADYAFVASYGYAPEPARLSGQAKNEKISNWISREHYFRAHATKNLWLYVGMLDKVYGIRIVDHTAVSRSTLGLGQNDQAHSVIAHYVQPTWELSGDLFFGNLYQASDLRQKGFSTLFDYELQKDFRVGTSLLVSNNSYVKNERLGFHTRRGFTNGAALLFETGFAKNTPTTSEATTGMYLYSETMQKLARGYHLLFTGQIYKDNIKTASTDILKLRAGFLIFPLARLEYRLEFENSRTISGNKVDADGWSLYNQLHISL